MSTTFRLTFFRSSFAIGFENFTFYLETPLFDVALGAHSDLLIHTGRFSNV